MLRIDSPKDKIKTYIIVMFAFFTLFLYYGHFLNSFFPGLGNYPHASFLLLPDDRYMDFFNTNHDAFIDNDPYVSGHISYPPAALIPAYIFSTGDTRGSQGDAFAYRHSHAGEKSFVLMQAIFLAIIWLSTYSLLRSVCSGKKKPLLFSAALLLLCSPLWYLLNRGNYLLVALAFAVLGLAHYEKRPVLSAIPFAVSASLKIYPVFSCSYSSVTGNGGLWLLQSSRE
jgi:hypothetical protein